MRFSLLIVIAVVAITVVSACTKTSECEFDHQTCVDESCICTEGWIGDDCSYDQKDKLVAFLLSLLVGALGADWFYLAAGNGWYIFAGILKLFTLGGCSIWWLVDWIRVLCDGFPDGNGQALNPF